MKEGLRAVFSGVIWKLRWTSGQGRPTMFCGGCTFVQKPTMVECLDQPHPEKRADPFQFVTFEEERNA